MLAIQMERTGGPEVLNAVERPEPVPGPGEVRVRAQAIGVGKPDVLMRTGVYRWMPALPAIPGAEMSGVIEALGPGVSGLRTGQPVLVYSLRGGCYAQCVAAPVEAVTALPEGIAPNDAVSIPNYQVALALLTEAARGIEPATVYVNGAAGGVGSAIIQLCRLRGVQVIAGASSEEKCRFALAQGASAAVNYGSGPVADQVLALTGGRGVDLSLDHLIGPQFTDTLRMLAPLGMIVSFNMLGGWPQEDLFKAMRAQLNRSPAVRCFTMHSYDTQPERRQQLMAKTLALFVEGRVKPPVFRKLPLAEARSAHQWLDQRAVLGKLILEP
jgi:NADPH:quinone reductase